MGSLNELPLYLLLATDVINGIWTLLADSSFSAAALAVKATVATTAALLCKWTVTPLLWLLMVVLCVALAILAFPGNADSNMLALKVGAVLALFTLLDQYWPRLSVRAIHTFLIASLLVITLSLFLGIAGIGHDRYLDLEGIGLRRNGFLVAGNEINIALVGLFWWLASMRHQAPGITLYSFLYWLCLVLMITSQSKTTIIGAVVTLAYFHRARATSIIALLTVVPIAVYLFFNSAIWARWVFFYGAFAQEGVISAITGGRFGRVSSLDIDLTSLLESGASVLASTGGYIESDPLDLLFNFGAVGLVMYALFAVQVYRACKGRFAACTLVIFASVFAGHVVYSVFAAPILFLAFRASVTAPVFGQRLRLDHGTQGGTLKMSRWS